LARSVEKQKRKAGCYTGARRTLQLNRGRRGNESRKRRGRPAGGRSGKRGRAALSDDDSAIQGKQVHNEPGRFRAQSAFMKRIAQDAKLPFAPARKGVEIKRLCKAGASVEIRDVPRSCTDRKFLPMANRQRGGTSGLVCRFMGSGDRRGLGRSGNIRKTSNNSFRGLPPAQNVDRRSEQGIRFRIT